jgi:hypothetical protein
MMFEVKEYAQFHPSRALECLAVVEAKRNIPVRTIHRLFNVRSTMIGLRVESESVPRRPRKGKSTMKPPMMAPGTPITEIITVFLLRTVSLEKGD